MKKCIEDNGGNLDRMAGDSGTAAPGRMLEDGHLDISLQRERSVKIKLRIKKPILKIKSIRS